MVFDDLRWTHFKCIIMIVRTLACVENGVIIWPLVAPYSTVKSTLFSELLLTCNLVVLWGNRLFQFFVGTYCTVNRRNFKVRWGENRHLCFPQKNSFFCLLQKMHNFFCTVLKSRSQGPWENDLVVEWGNRLFKFFVKVRKEGKESAHSQREGRGGREMIISTHLVRCYHSKL